MQCAIAVDRVSANVILVADKATSPCDELDFLSTAGDPTELLRDIKSACAAPNKLHALKTLAERERIQSITTKQALKQLENLLGATFPAEGDPDRLAYMKFAAQQKPLPMSSEGWRKMRESFLKKQQDGI
ncbi:unnamed protein product [Cyprideis torosa]|uniref:Uncharacterized protein n=1 Tax=Cyprideis torosa TaxID=163714 RepID=A0A7R8ZQ08_9CRUS|nr:unnamed protein product [Cyprideis torosa]CAG0900221.1 unnamed protein product [Cyprideis torosa]